MQAPTYEVVREEVIQSLDDIVATVPEPKEVVREPEDEPFSCSNPLLLSKRKGAFFTGQWAVYVPEDFDIRAYVTSLPGRLGAGWEERKSSIEVSFANVDLVREEPRLTVSVQETEINGRRALDLIAISRCGVLPEDEPEPVGPRGVRKE
ncbi:MULTISPECIES: hypothetical protein [Microbacterium]|uniref:hypothetical protein n=1 Tax=Microbacterium TaxID=33882 RepID=UPI00278B15E5|nr:MULTISPECIES: hypothetical protein [Microbacterium]MDQ1083819.1 hypothetical protein [Microbacterium sp. SORGH_AS_0344]MDQ1170902.1 hypothetical protein [Microbacterium proteolyticum]